MTRGGSSSARVGGSPWQFHSNSAQTGAQSTSRPSTARSGSGSGSVRSTDTQRSVHFSVNAQTGPAQRAQRALSARRYEDRYIDQTDLLYDRSRSNANVSAGGAQPGRERMGGRAHAQTEGDGFLRHSTRTPVHAETWNFEVAEENDRQNRYSDNIDRYDGRSSSRRSLHDGDWRPNINLKWNQHLGTY